jgi:hypothetical protein
MSADGACEFVDEGVELLVGLSLVELALPVGNVTVERHECQVG